MISADTGPRGRGRGALVCAGRLVTVILPVYPDAASAKPDAPTMFEQRSARELASP